MVLLADFQIVSDVPVWAAQTCTSAEGYLQYRKVTLVQVVLPQQSDTFIVLAHQSDTCTSTELYLH